MKQQKMLQVIASLISVTLLSLACSMIPTPTPTPPPTPTSTPTPTPTSTPTPTPTPTPTHTPTPTPTHTPTPTPMPSSATISVDLDHPVKLYEEGVELTITGISNAGHSIGEVTAGDLFGKLQIRPEHRDTHYLLKLDFSLENLSNRSIGVGAGNVRATDEEGEKLEFGGFCPSETMCGARLVIEVKAHDTIEDVSFVFAAPNELEQFKLYFLGCRTWADIKKH